jgi:2,3-bisphosphoglycerate-independent phosphoglycerate mutase
VKTHTRDPVPFVVIGKGQDSIEKFSEKTARLGKFGMKNAEDFLPFLFS